jgi:D-alanyl-D-alanine carboxypeptidase/D-alanyl-D-alanine-endopeptidase (penicillin-binding protein 4)
MKKFLSMIVLVATASQAQGDELPARVKAALNIRDLPHESLSIHVADVDTGNVVLDWNADQARNPASTIKLLTTLVGLDLLGPTYEWRTEVFADGEIIDGRLQGDLAIKGYGDPFLVTDRVWRLIKDIRHAGVEDISGDLLIDDSWFRAQRAANESEGRAILV